MAHGKNNDAQVLQNLFDTTEHTNSEIADKLTKTRKLGTGVYGYVDEMHCEATGMCAAVKTIFVSTDTDEEKESHQKLGSALKHIDHPNISRFYGLVHWTKEVWLCSELMDCGMDVLYPLIYAAGGVIPESVIGKISLSVIKGLDFLVTVHKMCHGSINTAGILASRDGTIKIASPDIIASKLKPQVERVRACPLSTKLYISPDHAVVYGAPDLLGDVWSFGISILEVALGEFPYDTRSSVFEQLMSIVAGPVPLPPAGKFSPMFTDFLIMCLEKDKYKRSNYKHLLKTEFLMESDAAVVDMQSFVTSALDTLKKATS